MEETRKGIIGSFIDFINSFRNLDPVNDGKISAEDLNKKDKEELKRILEAGGNVKKIENAMGIKYRAKVDTNKAKKDAKDNNHKVIQRDKSRDNK